MMLKGKTVLIGVSGGIAAYKTAYLVSRLKKEGAEVHVIMTENACQFISPLTFETLSGQKCIVDTFDRNHVFEVEHVELAKKADVFMIAPATANVIGKIAGGIADDLLTAVVMAAANQAPVYIAPAMNTNMYENPIVQANIEKLKGFGYHFIDPKDSHLACGTTGKGALADVDVIIETVEGALAE